MSRSPSVDLGNCRVGFVHCVGGAVVRDVLVMCKNQPARSRILVLPGRLIRPELGSHLACKGTVTKCEVFMTNCLLCTSVLVLTCIATSASAAVYDGSWGIVIYTRSGACDPTYQSGAQIRNGIIFAEAGGVNMNGRVSPKGVVRVSVSAGGQTASGSGRLSSNYGSGVWRGQGNRGKCSGTWAAQRRG